MRLNNVTDRNILINKLITMPNKHEEMVEQSVKEIGFSVLRDDETLRNITYRDYSVIFIKKPDGVTRQLQIPNHLKRLQRCLLTSLNSKFVLHQSAYAVSGKSFIDNAIPHVGASDVLRVDIKDFFQTVSMEKVMKVIEAYYPENLEWFLNRQALFFFIDQRNEPYEERIQLPTGAPTSPFLANLALRHVDEVISDWAIKNKAVYTRYLDDITLSFREVVDPVTKNDFALEIKSFIKAAGYEPHLRKSRWIDPVHDRFTITGVDIRREQRVTGKYIKEKVKPAIEEVINSSFYTNPLVVISKETKQVNSFEECIPIYFCSLVPTLNYIKQVNPTQYNQQIDNIKTRLNRIGHLSNSTPLEVVKRYIPRIYSISSKNRAYGPSCIPSDQEIEQSVKSFDQALVYAFNQGFAKK